MVAADSAGNSPCETPQTPPAHRNRHTESARSAHICKLPGSTLRQDSCIVDPSTIERIAAALANGDDAYSWERAANLLGVPVAQIQAWISAGQLRVVDTFVTDRSFEEFCKNHGEELKASLIDPPTAKWLVSEYGVSEIAANGGSVSPARKHALVIRTCKCGRKIAGNPYFQHLRAVPVRRRSGSRRSIQ